MLSNLDAELAKLGRITPDQLKDISDSRDRFREERYLARENIEIANKRLKGLREDKARLAKDLEVKSESILETARILETKPDENESLQKEVDQEGSCSDSESRLKVGLEKDKLDLTTKLEQYKKETLTLQARLKTIESEKATLAEELTESIKDLSNTKIRFREFEDDKSRIEIMLLNRQQELLDLQMENLELDGRVEESENEASSLNRRLEDLEDERSTLATALESPKQTQPI